MSNDKPRVSIGLPVFNGENYLAAALDSLLAQTYSDFELVISDNASTDRTQEICKDYAAKDRRIRYYRNDRNLGAAKNHNRVFELSTGQYFKWAAHDDLCAPEYIERCVEVLDRDPSVVLCHPKTSIIDEHGRYQKDFDDFLDLRSPSPHERFRDYLFRRASMWSAICGVIRASELRKTSLIRSFMSSDKVLLGELVLRGKIYRLSDCLFYRRYHPEQVWRANPTSKALASWLNPENRGKILLPARWKHFFEYLHTIARVRLSWNERIWCYLNMMKWGYIQLILGPLWRTIKMVPERISALVSSKNS